MFLYAKNFVNKQFNRPSGLIMMVILVVIIGFNGYLNPFQTRTFGDLHPVQILQSESGHYEFYLKQFWEGFVPTNNSPYRAGIDKVVYEVSNWTTSSEQQWVSIFLPLLVSIVLSSFIFIFSTKRRKLGFL